MMNLIDWAQADWLMYFTIAILLAIPVFIVIWLVLMVRSKKK
jgi:membrane protein DedA with SNARE-associated domain